MKINCEAKLVIVLVATFALLWMNFWLLGFVGIIGYSIWSIFDGEKAVFSKDAKSWGRWVKDVGWPSVKNGWKTLKDAKESFDDGWKEKWSKNQ